MVMHNELQIINIQYQLKKKILIILVKIRCYWNGYFYYRYSLQYIKILDLIDSILNMVIHFALSYFLHGKSICGIERIDI